MRSLFFAVNKMQLLNFTWLCIAAAGCERVGTDLTFLQGSGFCSRVEKQGPWWLHLGTSMAPAAGEGWPGRHLSLFWREEALWKTEERWDENWARSTFCRPSLPQLPMSSTAGPRCGGSHPFQTRQRTLDALPETELQTHPESSRHRQREILFSH